MLLKGGGILPDKKAKKTGIRPNTINELYWKLVDRINLNHIELICKTLHCKVEELIEIDED
ncbi:MAG: helix-turn-helix transcriptional regulator [Erysipelotrichaceae bacterium]|nr:helix-turn-helix transcriptional regulator [Erysipelotrichaceae bacterium]